MRLSTKSIPKDWPTPWFVQLEECLSRGDFDGAAVAAKRLRELGVEVRYPRPLYDDAPHRLTPTATH